jgi:hypothetical protein
VVLVDEAGNPVAMGEPGEIVTPTDALPRHPGHLNAPGKGAKMRLAVSAIVGGRMT